MNNSVKNSLLFLLIAALFTSSALVADFSKVSGSVEADLRQNLQLPAGPATQFVPFHIPGQGLFIVVTTDVSMRPTVQSPFGAATKRGTAPKPGNIRQALKTAVLNCRKLPLPSGENESLFIILVNRAFFSRPDSSQPQFITYKAYIPVAELKSAKDPGSKIHTE